jgi:hypothetical protein
MENKPGLKDGDPLPGSRMGNPGSGGQRGEVEQPAAPPGAEADEPLKCFQVADVGHFPDIAFDAGPIAGNIDH